jgi:hypothetical protein
MNNESFFMNDENSLINNTNCVTEDENSWRNDDNSVVNEYELCLKENPWSEYPWIVGENTVIDISYWYNQNKDPLSIYTFEFK